MKLTNRAMAGWAIAVFVVVGLVLILVALRQDGDTDNQQEQPVNRSLGVVR